MADAISSGALTPKTDASQSRRSLQPLKIAVVLVLGYEMFSGVALAPLQQVWIYLGSLVFLTAATSIYTALGGIKAVVWTDVIQATVMFGSLAFAVWSLLQAIPGGWHGQPVKCEQCGRVARRKARQQRYCSTRCVMRARSERYRQQMAAGALEDGGSVRVLGCASKKVSLERSSTWDLHSGEHQAKAI